jgi:site-specific recombinase XerD
MSGKPPVILAMRQWKNLEKALVAHWLRTRAPGERENWQRLHLIYFMGWCDRHHVSPHSVSDTMVAKFAARFPKKVREANLRRAWNKAAQEVPGWPDLRLSPPIDRRTLPSYSEGQIVTLPECEFHPLLVAEVARFCQNGGYLDPEREMLSTLSHQERMNYRLSKLRSDESGASRLFLPSKRPKPLSEHTLADVRRIIYKAATALHLAGEANVRDLRKIQDVATLKAATVLADSVVNRLGQRRAAQNLQPYYCVTWLARVARRCGIVFTYAEYVAWNELIRDLMENDRPNGRMAEKNLRHLLQLDDPKRFSMLVALPDVMMAEVERARIRRGKPKLIEAQRAKYAVAMDILNTLPIRRRTLATLDLNRNFLHLQSGATVLVVHPDQEKTRKTLEASLTDRSRQLLSLYVEHYRPLLPNAERTSYLFPGTATNGHALTITIATIITNIVKRRIGIHMHVNLWRHVMATKLGEKTQRVEDGGTLLGHRPGSRATNNYVRLGTRLATKQLREITDAARPEGVRLLDAARIERERKYRHNRAARRASLTPQREA